MKRGKSKRQSSRRDSKRGLEHTLEALYANGAAAQSAMRQALQSTEQACRNMKEICVRLGIKHSAAIDAEAAQRSVRRSAMSLGELMRVIEHAVNANGDR